MMNNELKHHGILGMKWGKRNGPPYPLDSGGKSAGKKHPQKKDNDSKSEEHEKKKSIHSMSDDELRQRIARLELERKYSELLSKQNTKKINKGKTFVVGILEKSGKNIGEQLGTYTLGTLVNKVAKKIPGIEGDVVNPKKGQKDK